MRNVHVAASISLGNDAVVPDEMPGRGRHFVVEQVGRRLRVYRPVVENGEAFLAGDFHRIGGQRLRNEAGRHVAMEGDRRAQRRSHGGEAGPFQKAPAVSVGFAAEHDPIRPVGVLGIEFEKIGLRSCLYDVSSAFTSRFLPRMKPKRNRVVNSITRPRDGTQ